jgi:hypothetical protein
MYEMRIIASDMLMKVKNEWSQIKKMRKYKLDDLYLELFFYIKLYFRADQA